MSTRVPLARAVPSLLCLKTQDYMRSLCTNSLQVIRKSFCGYVSAEYRTPSWISYISARMLLSGASSTKPPPQRTVSKRELPPRATRCIAEQMSERKNHIGGLYTACLFVCISIMEALSFIPPLYLNGILVARTKTIAHTHNRNRTHFSSSHFFLLPHILHFAPCCKQSCIG